MSRHANSIVGIATSSFQASFSWKWGNSICCKIDQIFDFIVSMWRVELHGLFMFQVGQYIFTCRRKEHRAPVSVSFMRESLPHFMIAQMQLLIFSADG